MRRYPRFSIPTSLLCLLLLGCLYGIWSSSRPWVNIRVFASRSFSPDGVHVAEVQSDSTLRLWDIPNGEVVSTLQDLPARVLGVAVSKDASLIATVGSDATTAVWDTRSGRLVCRLAEVVQQVPMARTSGRTTTTEAGLGSGTLGRGEECLQFSPNGELIAELVHGAISAYRTDTGCKQFVCGGETGEIYGMTFSCDGARILTSNAGGTAQIWDSTTGRLISVLKGHEDFVARSEYSPDGERIVTASEDGDAAIWDAFTGQQLHLLAEHMGPLAYVAYSRDGKRVVTTGRRMDTTARIWDAESGQCLTELKGHVGDVVFGEFSRDGSRIVTASQDNTARIWDPITGACLSTLGGHGHGVESARFTPDGDHIITCDGDGVVRVWRRLRLESPSGLLLLPETWLAALLACALAWSIRRDSRTLYPDRQS